MGKTNCLRRKIKCKCCNSSVLENYHLIFDNEGKETNIKFLLFDVIGLQVSEENGIDQAVCNDCLNQLKQSYTFKQRCLNNCNIIESDNDSNDSNPTESINENILECAQEIYNNKIDNDTLVINNEIDIYGHTMKTENMSCNEKEKANTIDEFQNDKSLKAYYCKPLIDVLSNESLKEILSIGVPFHQLPLKPKNVLPESSNLDVEKIRTSDDLINILEDDYHHNENNTKRKRLDEDTADEFKIPKIDIFDVCENIEYLDEEKPIQFNEYFQSIVSVSYDENAQFSELAVCDVCSVTYEIKSFADLILHTVKRHYQNDEFTCALDTHCLKFGNMDALKNHLVLTHLTVVQPFISLTCQTCYLIFYSAVKFGKHMCHLEEKIDKSEENYVCQICYTVSTSRKRFHFHKQFHLTNARPKVCLICEIIFKDEQTFYDHVNFSHEQVFEHFCLHCDRSFSVESELKRHVYLHKAVRKYECYNCGKAFIDKQTLDEHKISHMLVKPMQCDICGKTFGRKSRLRKHLRSHEISKPENLPLCEQCGQVFHSDGAAFKHFQKMHNIDTEDVLLTYKLYEMIMCCEFCELSFENRETLVNHKKIHISDKPYECNYCVAKYDTYSKLKSHKNSHNNLKNLFTVERHYVCDFNNCIKTYKDWSNLVIHRKTVHLIKPTIFKCKECDETFYQSWTFSYHKKTMHENPLLCQICKQTFSTNKSLRSHVIKMHHEKKTKLPSKRKNTGQDFDKYLRTEMDGIYCIECNKRCLNRYNAITHIQMVHLKILNYFCDICEKGFYQRGDLNDHMRKHTAETPFSCHYCDYKVRKKSMLQMHIRTHTNERPYNCPYCPNAFKRSYVLKNHIKQHNGIKDFSCPIKSCGKQFRTNSAVNYHLKQIHQNGKIKKEKRQSSRKLKSIPNLVVILPGPKDNSTCTDYTISDHNYQHKNQDLDETNMQKVLAVVPETINIEPNTKSYEEVIIDNTNYDTNLLQLAINSDDMHRPKTIYIVNVVNSKNDQ